MQLRARFADYPAEPLEPIRGSLHLSADRSIATDPLGLGFRMIPPEGTAMLAGQCSVTQARLSTTHPRSISSS
jgi:hypothetical protein